MRGGGLTSINLLFSFFGLFVPILLTIISFFYSLFFLVRKRNYHIPYLLEWRKFSHFSFILSLKFFLFIFLILKIRDTFYRKSSTIFSLVKKLTQLVFLQINATASFVSLSIFYLLEKKEYRIIIFILGVFHSFLTLSIKTKSVYAASRNCKKSRNSLLNRIKNNLSEIRGKIPSYHILSINNIHLYPQNRLKTSDFRAMEAAGNQINPILVIT